MFVRLKLDTGAWANVVPKSWTSLRAYSGHSAAREVVQLQFGKIQIEVVLGGGGGNACWVRSPIKPQSWSGINIHWRALSCLEKNLQIFARVSERFKRDMFGKSMIATFLSLTYQHSSRGCCLEKHSVSACTTAVWWEIASLDSRLNCVWQQGLCTGQVNAFDSEDSVCVKGIWIKGKMLV